jgi:hypothetical protein
MQPRLLNFCLGASCLTPGITRRPAPLPKMGAVVSAVGCMPLFGIAPA